MRFNRNFAIALCISFASVGFTSCHIDQDIYIYNDWFFDNGACKREMLVGDSLNLPQNGIWNSDNVTVATVVNKYSEQILKAVGVGKATISNENENLKIYVTVKEREQ